MLCAMYLLHLWQRGQQGSDPLSRTAGLSPAGAIQLLKKWHHVESIYTGVLGTVENLLPAHSSVVKVALVNQQCCHHGVFLSSVTHALSLPLSTIFFFLRFLLPQILCYSVVALSGFFNKQNNKATQVRN